MPPNVHPDIGMPPPAGVLTAEHSAPATAPSIPVTIAFDPASFHRLSQLAPAGSNLAEVMVYALSLYEGLAEQAKKGYTQLQVRNPDSKAVLVYGGQFPLKRD